jgi:ATP-dependent helicase/nuclease subunit B
MAAAGNQNETPLTRGLHIHFDPAFDGGVAPRLAGDARAVTGTCRVGVLGLLSLLETRLGLTQAPVRPIARAMALETKIGDTSGFWNASAERDSLAVSQTLLKWRDELVMEGWTGQHGGQTRLKQLWSVSDDVPAGHADRLLAVLDVIRSRGVPDLQRITLYRERCLLPMLCQHVLVAMGECGIEIDDCALSNTPQTDNVHLLRMPRPRTAAREIAAWLVSEDRWRESVIIGADETLDAALAAFGLPVTGAAPANGGLGILRGVLLYLQAFADKVLDPNAVQKFLLLTQTPVPAALRWRLTKALQEWPAVGSDKWVEATDTFIAAGEKSEREKQELAARICTLFPGPTDLETKPLGFLLLDVLDNAYLPWLHRRQHVGGKDKVFWAQAGSLFGALRDEIQRTADILDAARLHRLLEEFASELTATSHAPREAGLASVQDPGSITESFNYVIWWNFTSAAGEIPGGITLTPDEYAYLESQKVEVHLRNRIQRHSCHWANPLQRALKQCVLVCPFQDARGDALAPHPFWSRVEPGNGNLQLTSLRSLYDYRSTLRELRELPVGRNMWDVSAEEPFVREIDSRSSMEAMVRCPAQWYYRYACGLRSGNASQLSSGALLQGNLFHEIANRILRCWPPLPGVVARIALTILDKEGPLLAADYYLRQSSARLAQLRFRFERAFDALSSLVHEAGVNSREETIQKSFDARPVEGRLDLVLHNPLTVVDFKTGNAAARRKELENGYAIQLAMYSWLVDDQNMPPAAYLVVNSAEWLMSEDLERGVSLAQTWEAFSETYKDTLREVHGGTLGARGVCPQDGASPKSEFLAESNRLTLEPECKYCDYAALCGQMFGEVVQ